MSDSKKDWPVGPGRNGLRDPYWEKSRKIKDRLRVEGDLKTKEFEKAAEKAEKKRKGKR
jgi:hypothetical protein